MEEAIKKAESIEDLEQLYLAVVSTNESAEKLYSSLSFHACFRRKDKTNFRRE